MTTLQDKIISGEADAPAFADWVDKCCDMTEARSVLNEFWEGSRWEVVTLLTSDLSDPRYTVGEVRRLNRKLQEVFEKRCREGAVHL